MVVSLLFYIISICPQLQRPVCRVCQRGEAELGMLSHTNCAAWEGKRSRIGLSASPEPYREQLSLGTESRPRKKMKRWD